MGYIYILTSPKGKSYIGQTIRPIEKRFEQHQKSNRCRALYNAIKFYGWGNFEKDWYKCPDEDLNFDEELLVREIGTLSPNGYNLREGGGSHGKMSKETKQKLSEVNLGKTLSDEHKQKIREANIGTTHSEETKQKIREVRLGTTRSEETKQKCRKAQIGKKHSKETIQKRREANSGENNHMSKRIYQYDIDGIFIDSFGSTGEAGRYIKKDGANIRNCVYGNRKTAYGFKWSYTLNIFM